jgi:tryptophan synthase alpha chain
VVSFITSRSRGSTGSDKLDVAVVVHRLDEIRQHTALPIGVGFGIKDADSAARLAAISDAVIVGSALVSRLESIADMPHRLEREVRSFVRLLRQAIDAV